MGGTFHPVLRVQPVTSQVSLVIADNAGTMAAGQKHTRRTCLNGPHREKWVEAEFSQLDKHNSYGMYGKPLSRSPVPSSGTVVRPIWNYSQKGCGTFKARTCMNGKQLVRMGHTFEHTYAACMEQHCFHLFIAFTAQLGFLIEDGDVVNAYTHVDAEGPTIYLSVDDVFQAWYLERYHLELPLGSCAPLLKAMQGHPEAGNWWSKHFDATCAAPLHLKPAFTEPTMYRRDDEHCTAPTMMIRQVDDILCGAEHAPDRDSVLDGISTKVTFKQSAKLTSFFMQQTSSSVLNTFASTHVRTSNRVSQSWAGKRHHHPLG
jgi:hypothetical protein